MSRALAVQTSKDRLVANLIVAIPAAALLLLIWKYQKPRPPVAHDAMGASTP